jgi:hypothetical protein
MVLVIDKLNLGFVWDFEFDIWDFRTDDYNLAALVVIS